MVCGEWLMTRTANSAACGFGLLAGGETEGAGQLAGGGDPALGLVGEQRQGTDEESQKSAWSLHGLYITGRGVAGFKGEGRRAAYICKYQFRPQVAGEIPQERAFRPRVSSL